MPTSDWVDLTDWDDPVELVVELVVLEDCDVSSEDRHVFQSVRFDELALRRRVAERKNSNFREVFRHEESHAAPPAPEVENGHP